MSRKLFYFTGYLFAIFCIDRSSEFSVKDCGKWNNGTDIPWVVGIYSSKTGSQLELLCQGTVVKNSAIVTSAHCVCGLTENKVKPDIVISTDINAHLPSENSFVIKVNQNDIYCHEDYKGIVFHPFGDIAVIKTPRPVVDGKRTMPVCVDWSDYDVPSIEATGTGLFTVWNSKFLPSRADFLNIEDCSLYTSEYFVSILDTDKICLKSENIPSDTKYSGTGLVIKNPQDGRYYLEGLLSVIDVDSPIKAKGAFIAATSIRRHINWLSYKCIKT